jgi:hypothetical protein
MDSNINSITSNGINPEISSVYDYVNNMLINPTVIMILFGVVVIYIVIFMFLGKSNSSDNSSFLSADSSNTSNTTATGSSKIIIIVMVGLFIVLAIINGLQYFFGVDIIASLKNIFSNNPEVDIAVINSGNIQPPVPEIKIRPQVFNIPGNNYVYPDAKALCQAYGARLATYQEVENAYNKGAEWCNYGWSDGQMALFPTQQKTYDGLQKIEGHENDCGRPGVNGGYMANPALKFGVNCYGYKPKMTPEEEELMQTLPHYPLTKKDIAFEKRVEYWKSKLTEILVSPFNYNNWSKI